MPAKRNIKIWDKYNRLTIIEILPSKKYWKKSYRIMKCKCECWNIKEYILWSLTTWHTKSCWCLEKEINKTKSIKYWMHNTRMYRIWSNMKDRCNNKNNIRYNRYWWRWITYNKKWETFEWFYEDMWWSYKEWLTIDRVDANWNYCKNNCRWATYKEQSRNTSMNRNYTYKWITKCLTDWSKLLKINYHKIDYHLRRCSNPITFNEFIKIYCSDLAALINIS